jgi:hypothetical protein
VNRIKYVDVVAVRDPTQRAADIGNALAKVFAPVTRDQYQSPLRIEEWEARQHLHFGATHLDARSRYVQRVDHRVAGYKNISFSDALGYQIGTGPSGRREVQIGDAAGKPTVDLLGPRRKLVMGAQSRLDMADWRARKIGRQRCSQSRRRVAMDQRERRPPVSEYAFQADDQAPGQLAKGRLLDHRVETFINRDFKKICDLIQHLTVLPGYADQNVEVGCGAERGNDR